MSNVIVLGFISFTIYTEKQKDRIIHLCISTREKVFKWFEYL